MCKTTGIGQRVMGHSARNFGPILALIWALTACVPAAWAQVPAQEPAQSPGLPPGLPPGWIAEAQPQAGARHALTRLTCPSVLTRGLSLASVGADAASSALTCRFAAVGETLVLDLAYYPARGVALADDITATLAMLATQDRAAGMAEAARETKADIVVTLGDQPQAGHSVNRVLSPTQEERLVWADVANWRVRMHATFGQSDGQAIGAILDEVASHLGPMHANRLACRALTPRDDATLPRAARAEAMKAALLSSMLGKSLSLAANPDPASCVLGAFPLASGGTGLLRTHDPAANHLSIWQDEGPNRVELVALVDTAHIGPNQPAYVLIGRIGTRLGIFRGYMTLPNRAQLVGDMQAVLNDELLPLASAGPDENGQPKLEIYADQTSGEDAGTRPGL